MDSFRSALARLRLSVRARFCESSSWPTVSESSLMSSQARTSRAAFVMAVAESGTAKSRPDLNVRPDVPAFPDDALDERLRGGFARLAVEPQDDERELRPVRDVVRAVGEEAAVEEFRAFAEEVLGRLPDAVLDGLGRDGPPAGHENLVQVRSQAEPVAVPVPIQVVAGRGEAFEHGLDVGHVDVGPADGGANLGERGLGLVLALPPFDSKKMAVATFWCSLALRMDSVASLSSLLACESFLPAMSVVTGTESWSVPSCSKTASRKVGSSKGADPSPMSGSLEAFWCSSR